jgi:tRNA-dihydrouridine synthase
MGLGLTRMFEQCTIRGIQLAPARFCAPLAGYTHSAFRRLVAELGGCGALWTEMLAARQILREDFQESPWLRRRPKEGMVVFQLMTRLDDPLERIMARLAEQDVKAVDLNLACDAWNVRNQQAGSALFEDEAALRCVVSEARRHWTGILTAKIRLGTQRPGWQQRLEQRVRFLADIGLDALVLHPRFFEDKFKRRARHELIPWLASLTQMPLIANGDLLEASQVEAWADQLKPACAVMIGRMAVVRPWLFATWDRPLPVPVNPAEIWRRMHDYILEDFPPEVALRRIQMFSKYFSANFKFGHTFHIELANAGSLSELRERAERFFGGSPALVKVPSVSGL